MSKKSVEIINDTNYSITDRSRPVKKKRHIFGTIVAIIISLLLALFMRYYIELSGGADQAESDDKNITASVQFDGQDVL